MKTKVKIILILFIILMMAFFTACNQSGCDSGDDNSDSIVDSGTDTDSDTGSNNDNGNDDGTNTGNDGGSTTGDDGSSNVDINGDSNTDGDGASLAIETEYAQNGPYRVTSLTVEAGAVESNYGLTIYYPLEMSDGSHPIITWGNGTGTVPSSYLPLLRHLASWGFVVVASNNSNVGNGEDMIAAIDYLIEQNGTPGGPFFNKLDTDRIGATGHSQGGGGAINAANDPRVVCSAPMAPAPGKVGGIHGPMLLIAGQQDTLISPALVENLIFNFVRLPTMFAIHKNMGHLQFAWDGGNAKGYLTAWFMYQLQDDTYAALAFIDGCEICSNPNWAVDTTKWSTE